VRSISFETEISREDIVQKIAQVTYLGRGAAAGEGKQAWTIEEGARGRRSGHHRCSALSCIPCFFQLPDIMYLPIVVTVCSTKVLPTSFFLCLPLGPIHLFLKKIINVWVSSTFIKKKMDDIQTRFMGSTCCPENSYGQHQDVSRQ
jgi:hypothetical protein